MGIDFAGVQFKNRVTLASGTCGFGRELAELFDLSLLGGICAKGLTLNPRIGNPPPRIAETPLGMLNSVGLQNPGVDAFIREELPFLRQFDTNIIANFSGSSPEEFAEIAAKLAGAGIDMLEVNISCPNVKAEGMLFGTSPDAAAEVTAAVKRVAGSVPVMVKLTPNVTDIVQIALACKDAGADALSLINTLLGMRFDLKSGKPILANGTGGLSGPAIFPVALRMVYQVANSVNIPILGLGGISSANDAREMLIAGAKLIGVGTAMFRDPLIAVKIIEELGKNEH
ncbi:MAG: dihydroorotate dehydrogenase [Oscillospiraceae bacterium]|jgi:dihydroorotate dehydrogenase (NAD+) catalytic subunit|nr:dihydroorotate dehydrogenase [Oscillospiraceae bacterium]